MANKRKFRYLIKVLILVTVTYLYSCDGEYDGLYETTFHTEINKSCDENVSITNYIPEEKFKYFRLNYSSFSLETYSLKGCSSTEKESCEILYHFDPEEIKYEGNEIIIEQENDCSKRTQFIKGVLVD